MVNIFPLGKIFTNNTVFFSEGLCLIYFSTRPKLPLLCAIFYISPTECKWLCWGKKTKTKTSSAGLVQILGVISVKLWWLPESSVRSGDGNLATDEGRLFSRWNKTAVHAQTWRHKRAQGWSKRHGRYSATSFRTAVRFHCWTFQRRFLVRSDKLVHLFTPHFPLWNGLPWIS